MRQKKQSTSQGFDFCTVAESVLSQDSLQPVTGNAILQSDASRKVVRNIDWISESQKVRR